MPDSNIMSEQNTGGTSGPAESDIGQKCADFARQHAGNWDALADFVNAQHQQRLDAAENQKTELQGRSQSMERSAGRFSRVMDS